MTDAPTFAGTSMDHSLPANIYGQEYQWEPVGFGVSGIRATLGRRERVGLSVALLCADVVARDIAKAGMSLWRRRQRRWEEVEPREHPLARLFRRRPNELMTWTQFWRMTILHLRAVSNAYVWRQRDRQGRVIGLIPLMPARVMMQMSPSGRVFYRVQTANEWEENLVGDTEVLIPARDMIHLRDRSMNGLVGLGAPELGAPFLALADAISRYQTRTFSGQAKLPVVFETDQSFTGEMADAAFRRVKTQLGKGLQAMIDEGDPLLLEAGLKAHVVAQTAKDAMTMEAWNATVLRICGLMQVPPHKIYHLESVKYDNQASADAQYYADVLLPTARNIEESFKLALLDDEEQDDYCPFFDEEVLQTNDMKAMNERIKIGMIGLMTINEGRERLGLQPISGGDVRLVPVNMAVMDDDNNVVAQAADGQEGNTGGEAEVPTAEEEPEPATERRFRLVRGSE